MARLENHAVGRDVEPVLVQMAQRLHDGGDNVGAATHRFGQDHVRPLVRFQLLNGTGQAVEIAAEAGTCDFPDVEAGGPQGVRVDQVRRLVVRDDARPSNPDRSTICASRAIVVVLPAPRKPPIKHKTHGWHDALRKMRCLRDPRRSPRRCL